MKKIVVVCFTFAVSMIVFPYICYSNSYDIPHQQRDYLVLLFPNGGEVLIWDSTYTILWDWNHQGGSGITYEIFLHLSTDGGNSYPYPITGTINPDSNSMEWTVPHISSITCRVMIMIDSAGTTYLVDESDSNFTITATGVEEKDTTYIGGNIYSSSILTGPLQLPEDKSCKIFDITGRQIHTRTPAPGIYFIRVDGIITNKVVKIK